MIDLLNKDTWNRKKRIFPYIVIIGTGGNGGYITQNVSQMMSIFNINGHLLIADPDIVEEKNLKNQLFVKRDIGKKKADVLAKRYSVAYNIPIASYSESYIEDIESIKSLFYNNHLQIGGYTHDVLFLPVIIGCVDNNYTRKIIHQFFEWTGRCLYLDVGNSSAEVPKDFGERPYEQWTEAEKEKYQNSGWDGQVVCGLKMNGKIILSPVAEVFPDVLRDSDEIAPSEVACSNIVAADPQRLLTNKMAAMSVSVYINELFQNSSISNHITFFHAKEGYMKSQTIK